MRRKTRTPLYDDDAFNHSQQPQLYCENFCHPQATLKMNNCSHASFASVTGGCAVIKDNGRHWQG